MFFNKPDQKVNLYNKICFQVKQNYVISCLILAIIVHNHFLA